MHTQIRRNAPGDCPICGMALEPLGPEARGESAELHDMSRRFGTGLLLSAPLVLWEMAGHLPGLGLHGRVADSTATGLELALATPVVLWAGGPFFVRAWDSVRNRSLNMFSLIALGTGAAYLYSVVATLAPGLFPSSLRGPDGAVPVYYEAAAVITVFVLLGQVLEMRARNKTRAALTELLSHEPQTARRVGEGEQDEEISLDRVQPGDRLRVRPGETVPVDGKVLEGRSRVDDHGRAAASGKGIRLRGHRRHAEWPGIIRYASRARRWRDHACSHRPPGGGRAAQPRARSTPG